MEKQKIFEQIRGGLIVSCQALEHEPLYTKEVHSEHVISEIFTFIGYT